ncbi:MAG: CHAD domain-containing protein [Steroidobacterales bacterium]
MPGKNLQADRSATGAVRGAALQHAGNAMRVLASVRPTDVEVHSARKEIKKARAALRLLRAALPEVTYRRENAALRSAAQALNAARDARVLLRTLENLRRRRAALGRDKAAAALWRALRRGQRQAQKQLREQPEVLAGARAVLLQVQRRAHRWRVGQHGWKRLRPAFQRIYRAGRRAGHAAHRRPDAPTLHEWRKQVQYLWHALQMLEPLQSKPPSKLAAAARQLAGYLGDEHDLALLQATVVAFGRRHRHVSEPLLAAIDQRRRVLRSKAMALGERLYAPKPRAMAARVGQSLHARARTAPAVAAR